MFARRNRLSKQKDFDYIFKNGKTIKGGFFKIFFLKNSNKENRFSVIVNKKVSKNAITRNKLKRLIRKELETFSFSNNNNDIIFLIYPNILDKIEEIANETNKALRKINLY